MHLAVPRVLQRDSVVVDHLVVSTPAGDPCCGLIWKSPLTISQPSPKNALSSPLKGASM